jgi:hypothetical protein
MAPPVRREKHELLGVYGSEEEARAAAAAAEQHGAPTARVGADADRVASMRAEMRDEIEQGFILPHAAVVLPKEGAKGFAWLLPIGVVVGMLVCLPFAFIDFGGSLGQRLLIAALCGAAMGATIAFIIGAGLATRGRFEANAADRGVTVRVPTDTEEVEAAMADHTPIRLDRLESDGTPDTVVVTEEQFDDRGVVETMAGHLKAAPHVAGVNDESEPDYDPEASGTTPSVEPEPVADRRVNRSDN